MKIWPMRIACWIPETTNNVRICNTYCFSTAMMVARKHPMLRCTTRPVYFFSTQSSSFIDPTSHLFNYQKSVPGVKRPALENTRFYLVQKLRMRGAVPPQIHMSSCCDRESPLRIVLSNSILRTYRIRVFRINSIGNK
jgi:hypothetical protein